MDRMTRRGWVAVLVAAGVGAAAAAPVRDADPLPVESKWKGKLTQKGRIKGSEVPLDLTAELTVTKRDGDKFEGELFEEGGEGSGIKLTYLVKGEVKKAKDGKGFTVEFKSFDFKDAESETFLNIPYTGTLAGKELKGTWKHPPTDDDTTIEGDFTLERVAK